MSSRIALLLILLLLLACASSLALVPRSLSPPTARACGGVRSNLTLHVKRPYMQGSRGRGGGGKGGDVINTPMGTIPVSVTSVLIFLNIAAFILQKRVPNFTNYFMKHNGMVRRGETYRLLTAIFLHGSTLHLGSNMYSLYNIGRSSEKLLGKRRTLIVYALSGALANAATLLLNKAPRSLGASSAVFGLVGSFGAFYVRNKRILGPQAEQALSGIKQTLLFNLVYGFASPEIDMWGHAAGFASGALLGVLVGPKWMISRRTGRVVDRPIVDINTLFGGFFSSSGGSDKALAARTSGGADLDEEEDDVFDIANRRNRRKFR